MMQICLASYSLESAHEKVFLKRLKEGEAESMKL